VPISAVGVIDIPSSAGIKRNAVAVELCKDSPKVYERSGLEHLPCGVCPTEEELDDQIAIERNVFTKAKLRGLIRR
jgi:hypothetical protein